MRKVLTIAVAALMVVALVGAASAAQDNWRVKIGADNGAGASPASGAQAGVYPTSVDGYDAGQDSTPYGGIGADTPGTGMHVAVPIDGQTDLYLKTIKAPAGVKTWDFFVAANVNSTANVIRPLVYSVSSTSLPTATYNTKSLKYYIKMVDNKGMAGAPANGTSWELPIPTAHSTSPFWTSPVSLPVIKLSTKSNAALAAEGYRMQLYMTDGSDIVTPEPSSMLALGSGLFGLAGFVIRRRRA